MQRRLTGLAAGALLLLGACENQADYRQIQTELNALVRSDDDARVASAQARLLPFGLSALPQLETALHAAPERGRLRLVAALGALDQPDAVAILRHLAVYDASPEVRRASESILQAWAARPGSPGERARAALARIAQLRASEPAP
jgi:hypothetical protein